MLDGDYNLTWQVATKTDIIKTKLIDSEIEITEEDKKVEGSISLYEKTVSLSSFNDYPSTSIKNIIFSTRSCYCGSKSGDVRVSDNNISLFANQTGIFKITGYLLYLSNKMIE